MMEPLDFFLRVLSLVLGGFLLIVLVTFFMEWRARRSPSFLPHPPDAGKGLFEPEHHYVLKLKDGERIGPLCFEGHDVKRNGPQDPHTPEGGLAFRKPDGRRVIVNGFDIRTAEEVAAPPAPAPILQETPP